MKTKLLFVIPMLLTLGIAGCSKDSGGDGGNPTGKQTIVINLPTDVISSRAVEEQEETDGTAITLEDIRIYLLSNETVIQETTFTDDEIRDKRKRIEQIPGTINRVMLFANTNGAIVGSPSTATELKTAFTVASQHPAGKTGLNGRTLTGEGTPLPKTPDPDPGHDEHTYKEVTIPLESLTSRMEVGTVKPGTGIKSVELLAVYVNNYFPKSGTTTPVFHGEDSDKWPTIPASPSETPIVFDPATGVDPDDYTAPQYANRYSAEVTLDEDSKVYAYHVFSGNLPHLILLIKGEYAEGYIPYDEDDGTEYPYFIGWVTYTKYWKGPGENDYVASMLPNNIYKMGVGATGIEIKAKDITPFPEMGPYDLGINVSIKPWTSNTVRPEV